MNGKASRLIDLIDERFKIPVNADVIEYIRRQSPFAHSDLGSKLIEISRGVANADYYCPSFRDCAYVALHTDAKVIFAIAIGMRKIAFRLPPNVIGAMGDGVGERSAIGDDWIELNAYRGAETPAITNASLLRLCTAACRNAESLARPG